jgi:predicted DNA binding CopG/RHH family protein
MNDISVTIKLPKYLRDAMKEIAKERGLVYSTFMTNVFKEAAFNLTKATNESKET